MNAIMDLVRPLPGARQVSRLRHRICPVGFDDSASYWERRYARGGTSGAGAYGAPAQAKADFLNAFVRQHEVRSVVELGCGDGNQLALADYPEYVGLDVSKTAIRLCRRQFAGDPSKSFCRFDGIRLPTQTRAELALSLDVIYHLVEDSVFEKYMSCLFAAARRYVVIYSTNDVGIVDDAPHVRHRNFTLWAEANCPQWRLTGATHGPVLASFFIYEQ